VLDRYNNVENLQGYEGQIAVILAGKDEVVPIKHGTRLYESLSGTKELWVFEDARHNEVPVGADLLWWKKVIAFIRDDDITFSVTDCYENSKVICILEFPYRKAFSQYRKSRSSATHCRKAG